MVVGRVPAPAFESLTARKHAGTAMDTLAEIASNKKFAPAARVSAAMALLDRGFGKPLQSISADVNILDELGPERAEQLAAALRIVIARSEDASSENGSLH